MVKNYKKLLNNINTFIFDYDGVFTNGIVIMLENGELLRTANVKDGYILQLAKKKGYRIAIISGGNSESIKKRFEVLDIKDIFLGVNNKIKIFMNYLEKHNLKKENVLFMGDDIPDCWIMREAGVATCPADAAEEIKFLAHYISHLKGGEGCVRDIVEQVMKVQGQWMKDDAFIW